MTSPMVPTKQWQGSNPTEDPLLLAALLAKGLGKGDNMAHLIETGFMENIVTCIEHREG